MTLALSSDRPIREVTEFADKVLRRQLESVYGRRPGAGRRRPRSADQRLAERRTAARLQPHRHRRAAGARVAERRDSRRPRRTGRPDAHAPDRWDALQSVERVRRCRRRASARAIRSCSRDVARIEDGMAEADSLANLNGTTTVMLQIRAPVGHEHRARSWTRVKERLTDMSATLPAGYDVRVVRDQSEFIKASVRTVEEHLIVGVAAGRARRASSSCGTLRSTSIAAIAIPTSIIATFGLIWYMGFTLNSMTMLALTLAVGIVIDDAIVVLENIWRFIEEKGMRPFEAAIEATREIGLAVLATTMSLVAIFIPVGVHGRHRRPVHEELRADDGVRGAGVDARELHADAHDVGPVAAAARADRATASTTHGTRASSRRSTAPTPRLLQLVDAPPLGGRGAGPSLVLLSSDSAVHARQQGVPPGRRPVGVRGQRVRAPEGTSLESTDLIADAHCRARSVERLPEVEFTLVTIGRRSGAHAQPGCGLRAPQASRGPDARPVRRDGTRSARTSCRNSTGEDCARASRRWPTSEAAAPRTPTLQLRDGRAGPEVARARAADAVAERGARPCRTLVDVDTSLNVGKPEVSVRVDRLKASRPGRRDLGCRECAAPARRRRRGNHVLRGWRTVRRSRARRGARPHDDGPAIGNLTVPSARLGSVPLENVASFNARSAAPSEINRLNRQRQVTIFANLLPARCRRRRG